MRPRRLGRFGPDAKAFVPKLIQMLGDDSDVLTEVIAALRRIGPEARPAVPALIGVVREEYQSPDTRVAAATALARIAPNEKSVVSALIELARNEPWNARAGGIAVLAKLGPAAKEAVPALMELIAEDDEEVSIAAVAGAGQMSPNDPAVIDMLTVLLRDRDPALHAVAARLLTKSGRAAKQAVPALIELLDDREGEDTSVYEGNKFGYTVQTMPKQNDSEVLLAVIATLENVGREAKAAARARPSTQKQG